MPTFTNPVLDAAEASEALRGLAHASRTFEQPAQMYDVIGNLLAGARSFRQILDQLANTHAAGQSRAFNDDGDAVAGARDALAAADELHQAATLIDAAHDRLDAAMNAAGRIAWHDTPSMVRQWVSIVFLQGEEADPILDLIQRDGTTAGIEHLRQWDYGEETTQAALENGYVYDTPPVGNLDRSTVEGDYALAWNPFLSNVSLLRIHEAPVDPALAEPAPERSAVERATAAAGGPAPDATSGAAAPAPSGRGVATKKDWFAGASRSSQGTGRGLGL